MKENPKQLQYEKEKKKRAADTLMADCRQQFERVFVFFFIILPVAQQKKKEFKPFWPKLLYVSFRFLATGYLVSLAYTSIVCAFD